MLPCSMLDVAALLPVPAGLDGLLDPTLLERDARLDPVSVTVPTELVVRSST